jgi:predicted PurR-regulated permease PerM
MGWGAGVIGVIDSLLYPIVVGRRVTLHSVPVFFAFLGGVMFFGTSGLVLGPLVLTVSWTILEFWRARTEHGRAATEAIRSEAS